MHLVRRAGAWENVELEFGTCAMHKLTLQWGTLSSPSRLLSLCFHALKSPKARETACPNQGSACHTSEADARASQSQQREGDSAAHIQVCLPAPPPERRRTTSPRRGAGCPSRCWQDEGGGSVTHILGCRPRAPSRGAQDGNPPTEGAPPSCTRRCSRASQGLQPGGVKAHPPNPPIKRSWKLPLVSGVSRAQPPLRGEWPHELCAA